MTERGDRLGVWCGWVLVGAAALTPLFAWLGPLGFAPLVGLMGLLSLPALRVERDDRLAFGLLAALAVWAALSSLWSPTHADALDDSTALKVLLQLPLYWAAICGARRADRGVAKLALKVLSIGLALYGVLLLVEAFTQVGVYRALRAAIGDPIEFAYARKNIAHGAFVLALLWPVAATAGVRGGAPGWLGAPMAVGTAVAAHVLLADAPVLAVGLSLAVMLAVGVWPNAAPKAMGLGAAGAVLAMPLVAWAILASGLAARLPESWAQRTGYWGAAIAHMADHPLRGAGLEASRNLPPIQLHPHNGALQVWLELGVVGAVLAALIWALAFRAVASRERTLLAAGVLGSASAYLLLGLVSFGVWQEWWLALAALVAVIAAAGRRVSDV